MKNSNSFMLKTFLEQWLPRLIALSIFAYLIQSLFFKQYTLSGLHITALAIIVVLILAPMASRLKVLNMIDFSSRLDGLKREEQKTESQLRELSNQISTVISMRISPIQKQTTVITGLEELFSSLSKARGKVDILPVKDDAEYSKERFLKLAYGYRIRAYTILCMVRSVQIALLEHRMFELSDLAEGMTVDEKTRNLLDKVLEKGLDTIFKIQIVNKKTGEKTLAITPEIIENLKLIITLIELCQKVESGEIEVPPRLDIDSLYSKIGDSLTTIMMSLDLVSTQSILYQYRITNAIKSLKNEIEQADTEQRPVHLPPLSADK